MSTIEIVGFGISIVVALIAWFVSEHAARTDSKLPTLTSFAIAFLSLLLGMFATSHINMRQQLDYIASKQFITKLRASEAARDLAVTCSSAENNIRPLNSEFLKYVLDSRMARTGQVFLSLQNFEIQYDVSAFGQLGELQQDVLNIFSSAASTSVIRATSYIDTDQWWSGSFGDRYTQENSRALERGVRIERIFIFSSLSELQDPVNREVMTAQVKQGVLVYYVLFDEIERFIDDKIDILLVDRQLFGVLYLVERRMKRAMFSCNTGKIEELHEYWTNIRSAAKEFTI